MIRRGVMLHVTFCLLFAGAPLIAAPEAIPTKTRNPSRWERLRAGIIVKDAEYIGNQFCSQPQCHADTMRTWTQLPHSRHVLNARDWAEDERSCEGCHGPASEHANDREQHGLIAKLTEHPEYVTALCNRCHHQDIKETHFLATVHAGAKVGCGTCHDVHRDHGSIHLLRGAQAWTQRFGGRKKKTKEQQPTPANEAPNASANQSETEPPRKDRGVSTGFAGALLSGLAVTQSATDRHKVSALCLSCHPRQRGELHQNSRHPLFDGRMTCTDCHNPHRAEEMTSFSQQADEQCTRCHTDKRGPFIFAHDMTGLGEGCQTCHTPHGSPNNKMTRLNGRALCLQCHSDINADPQHQLRPGSCWSAGCHADFHGSQTSRLFIATGARALRSPARDVATRQRAIHSVGRSPFGHRFGDSSDLIALLAQTPTGGPSESASPSSEEGAMPSDRRYEFQTIASFQTLGADGNLSKFYQYNVQPRGVFSDALRLNLFDAAGFRFGRMAWTGLDEPQQAVSLRLDRLNPTPATLRYDHDRASFFIEPSLNPRTVSERKNQRLLLRIIPSNKPPEIEFLVEDQRVNAPGLSRLTTGGVPGALNYRTTTAGPTLRAPLGAGSLSLRYAHENFSDNTGFLPRASSDVWQLRYDRDIGPNTSAFASLSRVQTEQTGLVGKAKNLHGQLGVVARPMRHVTASVLVSLQDIDLPNTTNAYVQDNDSVLVRVRYRPEARWSVEGGLERVALRRLNNVQNFIDTPRWHGGWLLLRATPAPNVNLSVRHTVRRLRKQPLASIPGSAVTLPLFFDDDDRTNAQLTVLLPRDALFYLNYGRTARDNELRQVGFRLNMLNLGLAMPLSQRLSFNVDWHQQNWSGRGDVLRNDPLRLNFGRPLTSDGDYVNAGLAYISGKNTVTANLYRFASSGGESVRGKGIWLGYERQLTGLIGARLMVGWDDYEDRVLPGFDNSDSFIRLDLIRRF